MGILAHVDAGKTTLSEAMLYLSGAIRKAGRVDNKDAFLDTYALERERGITIFSKQAAFSIGDLSVTLLDTPGHVDFSAEMERTLQVLDYAVLVINGADGVQGHTRTLWRLLARYQIPVFLFINKMDQNGTDRVGLLAGLKKEFGESCVDFSGEEEETFWEEVAVCSDKLLERYLEGEMPNREAIAELVKHRRLFPCFFGSALKLYGVKELLQGIFDYTEIPEYPAEFGAKVFKIARDAQGNRLTYLKVTGGKLRVKMQLSQQEKVNQIRIYSGEKYETADEISAGRVCAVTGLSETFPGEGIGIEGASGMPVLEPVLTYRLLLPEGMDAAVLLPKLRQLEEEEPELHIIWREETKEIQIQLMGEVQIEILKSLIRERFGVDVDFGQGNIVYKETIADTVEGVGHFEPLRHYAEVHLLMEPGEPGSGMVFAADCSEDVLDRNWQRLILTHLEEREFAGILTGSPITDMKITLVAGRAHQKHTEGGDFRQATYRAVRQGLMRAECILLEPFYDFTLEIPETMVGRAMTDLERMYGKLSYEESEVQNGMRILKGTAPVACMQNYQSEVTAYTKGLGKLFCSLRGYGPCHNPEEVVEKIGYDPERDFDNPSGSVFCAHGAGFVVPWEEVKNYMHLESCLSKAAGEDYAPVKTLPEGENRRENRKGQTEDDEIWMGTEEIDRILNQTYNANKKDKSVPSKNGWKLTGRSRSVERTAPVVRNYQPKKQEEEYLLVDGYNIVFAWEELKALAAVNIDGARGRLLDILSNYQGIRGCQLIVVFDAYRVAGHQTEIFDYHNIHVVYTKEAETADQYIEKFAHENGHKYRVTVATSDGLEQIIIRGAGCYLMSARELFEEVFRKNELLQETYQSNRKEEKNYLLDGVDKEALREITRDGQPERNG